MKHQLNGSVVYDRNTFRRGKITHANDHSNMISVHWDDGQAQLVHVSSLMSEKLYNETKGQERLQQMSIKEEQCIVGTVVYLAAKEAPLRKGKIAGPIDPNLLASTVIVEWDNGNLNKQQIKFLLSEIDGAAENKRLLEEQERLEKEFEQVEQECAAKLEKAGKLIREAAKLAESHGKDLQEMYEATRGVENAMRDAGWNTSSWHC